MNRLCGIFGFVLLLCAPSAWAQKGLSTFKKLPQAAARSVETQFFKLVPARTLNLYGAELRALRASNQLSRKKYPRLARQNELLLRQSIDLFVRRERLFYEQAPAIARNIKSRVYRSVPYAELLPENIDVLYIGEVHGVPRVQKEIGTLVKSLRTVYPGRKIYLAAESVPAAYDLDFSVDDLVRGPEVLAERLREVADLTGMKAEELLPLFSVVQAALEEQIPVLGLESEGSLFQFASPEKGGEPTDEDYEAVVTSLVGMEFRNKGFAQGVSMLRAAEPDALVVVYGGIDHFAYHQPSSVPSLVAGKSFVVQVTVPGALPDSNPLFKNFRESESIRRDFASSPDAKLVEFWKEPTEFNQILGNDLTIIVHE